ncbi:MAG: hypothetical protein IT249_09845 [Chitinophagaceae bacterium]|nr:hypothetical protein [Chitinophagaceae bacterium]
MIRLFIFFYSLVCCNIAIAQKAVKNFELNLPEQKISHSLYNTIEYIDSRSDTSNMGIVQTGAFNKKARVVPATPFNLQLQKLMDALTDNSTSGKGVLLFQLRQLSFAEITGAMSEKGYCYLRAALYEKQHEGYSYINSIDTILVIKSMDVTKRLFRDGSKLFAEFIGGNLNKPASDEFVYTYADIVHIDSLEKKKLKVYNMDTYTDGVYTSYRSFTDQLPDYTNMDVMLKRDTVSGVKVKDAEGKIKKIKSKDIYAVIYNGKIFIATDYGYYPAEKYSNDFLFPGKAKVAASTGDMIAAGVFFGIIGSLIAENTANATFEMKIDHINGGFIRLREVKTY